MHPRTIASPQAREIEKMYNKKLGKKKQEKTLVVGRRFEAASTGKQGHGIKYVDARSRSDSRGERKAEKEKKKSGGGKGSKKKGVAAGSGVQKAKGNRQKKGGNYRRK